MPLYFKILIDRLIDCVHTHNQSDLYYDQTLELFIQFICTHTYAVFPDRLFIFEMEFALYCIFKNIISSTSFALFF